jgi:ABC-2 type transport system ATP-binding protein
MRIEALLDMVGLKAVANRPIGTFSKGMARRIAMAQALINDPDLLMLDEPTTGLDPIGTRQIKDLILQLAKRGKTILLCSHLLADVEDVCDRIAILYGGKIQSEGRVKELLQQTNKIQITTGAISDTAVEKIEQIVRDEQADCVVASPMDKLETFFIRTVAAAQQLSVPTSGAVSTTQIGHFLAPDAHPEDILDKLVSAPVEQEVPLETSEPEPVAKVKPVAKKEQIKKSILDRLTGRSNESDSSQTGDRGNA